MLVVALPPPSDIEKPLRRDPQAQVCPATLATSELRYAVGEESRKAAIEATNARIRYESGSVFTEVIHAMRAPDFMLNPATAEASLRDYAVREKINFDQLVAGAAAHFTSPVATRRTAPLSGEELEILFEDDQRTFDRKA